LESLPVRVHHTGIRLTSLSSLTLSEVCGYAIGSQWQAGAYFRNIHNVTRLGTEGLKDSFGILGNIDLGMINYHV